MVNINKLSTKLLNVSILNYEVQMHVRYTYLPQLFARSDDQSKIIAIIYNHICKVFKLIVQIRTLASNDLQTQNLTTGLQYAEPKIVSIIL